MKNSIKNIRSEVDKRRGQQQQIEKDLSLTQSKLEKNQTELIAHEQAREVIKEVGQKTQQALAFHISDISTLALEAVFGKDAYNLVVDFVQRRNKTECDLWFERAGQRINPIDGSGGGAVDVAAFALRVASWSMERPRTRPVIILDEPMRFLSQDLQPKASEMIKELSEKLNLQFIIITHESELTHQAQKIFEMKQFSGVSRILNQ